MIMGWMKLKSIERVDTYVPMIHFGGVMGMTYTVKNLL